MYSGIYLEGKKKKRNSGIFLYSLFLEILVHTLSCQVLCIVGMKKLFVSDDNMKNENHSLINY